MLCTVVVTVGLLSIAGVSQSIRLFPSCFIHGDAAINMLVAALRDQVQRVLPDHYLSRRTAPRVTR